jgi:hypothetical protein
MYALHRGINTVYQVGEWVAGWAGGRVGGGRTLQARQRMQAPRTCTAAAHPAVPAVPAAPAVQSFTHTELIDKLWWPIELVMVTPSHHRVHHARNYGRK